MDFVSGLLVTLPQPQGFWESMLNAFKGVNGTYILAVILIALLVRVVFAFVDIFNKKVSMKNNEINAKMKPELDAIKKKYEKDPTLMQQKTNEVYKKYQFNMMGSCLPMLVMLVLQMVVFFTLWSSLQTVSNYNIASQYQEMKNTYANVIQLNQYASSHEFKEGDKIEIKIYVDEDGQKRISADIVNEAGDVPSRESITSTDGQDGILFKEDWSNDEIYKLIQIYVPAEENEEPSVEEDAEDGEDETPTLPTYEYVSTGYNEILAELAGQTVRDYYLETQEGFLWIKNIYKADAPQSPMFTKNEIKNYLSKYYNKEEKELEAQYDFEGEIFGYIVADINTKDLGNNGYYILTLLAVLSSVLSLWLSNYLMTDKSQPKQKKSWMMYVIMPLIIGIFTFSYTSLFAIYLVVGQLAMIAVSPLSTWIVKKWNKADGNKKKDKDVIEVDYRRK